MGLSAGTRSTSVRELQNADSDNYTRILLKWESEGEPPVLVSRFIGVVAGAGGVVSVPVPIPC